VLVVDSVAGVSEIANDQLVNAEESLSFAGYLSGVTVFENKIILITDLEKFLSMDEEQVLNKAIKEVAK